LRAAASSRLRQIAQISHGSSPLTCQHSFVKALTPEQMVFPE